MASTKQRAILDAKQAQESIEQLCKATDQPLPAYQLTELIGKGSFGRVYKAICTTTAPSAPSSSSSSAAAHKVVAIKMINIEQGDMAAPGLTDTFADLHGEIRALQALRGTGAQNINHVIEALLVGPAVWVVIEYCAGGSVATLMRPTRPGGLRERWIIPVLREVAVALHWVHSHGIIHRDVKAANVLVAEDGGGVQLCDFGVAATVTALGGSGSGSGSEGTSKRSTVVGTAHWMAPELLGSGRAAYGKEVDVWAFGAMAYELATGYPPNAMLGMGLAKLGRQLQMQMPRLQGDQFSEGLKDLVACCLQRDVVLRPTIEQVQRHSFICGTEAEFPTQSLSQLVRAFRIWEGHGGDRHSLFAEGGAPMVANPASSHDHVMDDWNFSTAADFESESGGGGIGASEDDKDDVYHAYGSVADLDEPAASQQDPRLRRRRRRYPQRPALQTPLEKVFDSNTLSSYDAYSKRYYARFLPESVQEALLQNGVSGPRADWEPLIDLDMCLVDGSGSLSASLDLTTMRPSNPPNFTNDNESSEIIRLQREYSMKRRTQDWKFPGMLSRPPPALEQSRRPSWPDDMSEFSSSASHSRSFSTESLINLDESVVEPPAAVNRSMPHPNDSTQYTVAGLPVPDAPLPQVLLGKATDQQLKEELHRMTASLADHLRLATDYLADLSICGANAENPT